MKKSTNIYMFLIINNINKEIKNKCDYIIKILYIINQNEFVDFDLLQKIYNECIDNLNDEILYENVKESICNRIIYQLINNHLYKEYNIDVRYICDKLIQNFYMKSNSDKFDLRLKCFAQQFIIQYVFIDNKIIDINTCLQLGNININQSLNSLNPNIFTEYNAKKDILNLYEHFFDNFEYQLFKMNVIELANYIGSFFYHINLIETLSQLYIINLCCHYLFRKIDSLIENELLQFIKACENNELINLNTYIFYYYYAKCKYDLYCHPNLLVIIDHYNNLITDNENNYFNYLNDFEKKTGLFHCEYTLIYMIKYNFQCCIDFIHYYEYVEKHYLPKYIYKIAKNIYKLKILN